jgi:copper chaperone CopZ
MTALSPSSITVEATLTLNIPTMGCVACVNKVDASIRGCNSAARIREETSWLTGGAAKGGAAELVILGRTNEEINRVVDEVVAAVKDAGFRCDVESLRVDKR